MVSHRSVKFQQRYCQLSKPNQLRLPNPLDKYTTFSTHHIMVAARASENAKAFANGGIGPALEAVDRAVKLGDNIPFGNAADIYLVMDTRRFSQYSIERLEYEALVNGMMAQSEVPATETTLSTAINMTIIDANGFTFINFMQWLMDTRLQTSFNGIIFVLRTFFVGHLGDGTSEVVDSISIPMMMQEMNLNLDYAKGIYDCVFMPYVNFPTNYHREWLNIGTANKFFTGAKTNKLGDLIASMNNELNQKSWEWYKRVNDSVGDIVNAVRPDGTRPAPQGRYGRRVNYVITIPQQWLEFEFTGSAINSAIERDRKKEREEAKQQQADSTKQATSGAKTPAQDTHTTVDAGITIPQALDYILGSVVKLKEFGNADKVLEQNGRLKFYKYVVGVSSTDTDFTVQVHVVPFDVPQLDAAKEQSKAPNTATPDMAQRNGIDNDDFYVNVTTPDGLSLRVPKNFWTYDYIFTGKNLDVLEFDMKLQNLMPLLAANTKVGDGEIYLVQESVQKEENGGKEAKPSKALQQLRPYDPILLPLVTAEELANFSKYATPRNPRDASASTSLAQQYTRNVSAFYGQSPIISRMVIRGNPLLMGRFSDQEPLPVYDNISTDAGAQQLTAMRKKFDEYITRAANLLPSTTTEGAYELRNPLAGGNWQTQPFFVKVNIKSPNIDFTTNQMVLDGSDLMSEVLMDNYYVIFKIKHTITGGSFTQEMELYGHNVYGTYTKTDAKNSQQPKEI